MKAQELKYLVYVISGAAGGLVQVSSTLSKFLRRMATHSCRRFFPVVIALMAALAGMHSAHGQLFNRFTGYTIPLSATVVSENPPELRLQWDYTSSSAVERRIYRREKMEMANANWSNPIPDWGVPIATLTNAANTLSYSDTTLVPGKSYEYKMEAIVSDGTAAESRGFVSGGINVPMPENRGKLLLLVDSSQASALAPELAQLEQDLAGDGWTVQRTDLPRGVVEPATTYTPAVGAARLAEITAVKTVITSAYNADPANVKAVYIVGHLAVPYAGAIAYDAHTPQHSGAWAADTYYADVNNESWTDTQINFSGADDPRNWNVPGDGKFDQYVLLTDTELQVGRVDFKNMTVFPTTAVSETELLRRYLRKAHDYRRKQGAYAAIDRRAIAINTFASSWGSESMTTSIAGTLGRDPGLVDSPTAAYSPWFAWMEANPSKTYLIGSAQTAGSYVGNGAGWSTDFGLRPSRSVFNVLFGSYMGDWDTPNNFMRASLAGNASGDSLGLTCFWGGRPNLYMQSMGLGETIGYAVWVSQNCDSSVYPTSSGGNRGTHTGLMGDPALRLYTVQPPQNLQAASSGGSVTLNWSASTESNLLGYLVYRGTSPTGPFTKLTASPITPTTYTDSTGTVGTAYT
ncbi:MAG: fibronectin type III domain-containing protein, partial [Verrucomicrobiota bacterium]